MPPDEWDADTDEINSLGSDELYETRPNRWTGAESTWRTLTDADRQTYTALRAAGDADLAVHLYNAFALKQPGRFRRGELEDIRETGDVTGAEWAPDKQWTAWPVRPHLVPDEGFMAGLDGREEEGTFRARQRTMPSTGLEEEISATMLRIAKERFRRRDPAGEGVSVPSLSTAGSRTSSYGQEELSTRDATSDSDKGEKGEATTSGSPPLVPTVSTDDDLSYDLLRPAARDIISRLDRTLTVLHNARVAACASSSRHSEPPETADEDTQHPDRRPRMRGRSRSERYRLEAGHILPVGEQETTTEGAGRPRKTHVPRDGESAREMQVRVARESKKRIPRTEEEEEHRAQRGTAARTSRRKKRTRPVSASPGGSPSGSDEAGRDRRRGKRMALLAPRDWKDVVGAAALAGFSAATISRAAQRCANLFGEGMEIHTLAEGPVGGVPTEGGASVAAAPQLTTTRYTPGVPVDRSTDGEEDAMTDLGRSRSVSRQPSGFGSRSSPEEERRRRAIVCSHPECPRAARGFGRRANLVRHLQLVHGEEGVESGESADEMDGAVHVDGFLRPIKVRKGWRGVDRGGRERSRGLSEGRVTRARRRAESRIKGESQDAE